MIIRQVKFAFDLLQYFAERQSPATVSELADHFGWPRSSTVNQVETLCHLGLLHEPISRQGYYPTSRLLDLGSDLVRADPVGSKLDRLVRTLAETSGETVAVAALAGHAGLFINAAEPATPIRYFAQVGQRIPLHATAAGRALLSQLSPRDLRAILERTDYISYAEHTPMSAAAVMNLIEAGRACGYFVNANGYAKDLVGVALPFGIEGRTLSLLVAGPIFRVSDDHEAVADQLRQALKSVLSA